MYNLILFSFYLIGLTSLTEQILDQQGFSPIFQEELTHGGFKIPIRAKFKEPLQFRQYRVSLSGVFLFSDSFLRR